MMSLSNVLRMSATLLLVWGVGCSGPERATRQPITGVDRPAGERAPNQHDEPRTDRDDDRVEDPDDRDDRGASMDSGTTPRFDDQVREFAEEIARAHAIAPGPVAVFWPLSKHPGKRDARHVNGLGERLNMEISDALRDAGVTPIEGDTLKRRLRDANRSLQSLRELEDSLDLAERIGASYVVYGTVDRVTYSRLQKDEELRISVRCRSLFEDQYIASLRSRLRGGRDGRDLFRDYQLAGDVEIGEEAGRFEPRTDLEATILMRMLARRVVLKHGVEIADRRVVIEPTSIRAVSGPRAERQALMAAFDRAYQKSLTVARSSGVENPEIKALEQPFRYASHEFESLDGALDFIERERGLGGAEPAEELATDLARSLSESLREAGGNFEAVGGAQGREAILAVVHREAAAAEAHDAVDPATIARLRQKGAQVLVRSTLREYLGTYQLRIILHDMQTNRTVTEAVEFESGFKSDLARYTG